VRSRWRLPLRGVMAGVLAAAVSACSSSTPSSGEVPSSAATSSTGFASSPAIAPGTPRPDHVVVVVMENHSAADISGNREAPYIDALAGRGALFARSFAVAHPSEPNYLALFSGSTQGVTSDACPLTLTGTNLAAELAQAGGTFAGYSEGLPAAGDPVCSSGKYARKHAPWVNFPSLPATVHQPFTAFPSDFAALPTVSFVIPDLDHDMHDGSVATGDTWLAEQLGPYATPGPKDTTACSC